jgi:Phage Tail Protein X.
MYLTHITTDGERWDQLAHKYYGDPTQYERIIAANPHMAMAPILPAGVKLAIPVVEQSDVVEDLPPWMS